MTKQLPYAYALIREDPPALFVAESLEVLHKVLALHVVAQVPAAKFGDNADFVKDSLLEERWADAVLAWIDLMSVPIDVFPDGLELYTQDDVGRELSDLRLQFTPLFESEERR